MTRRPRRSRAPELVVAALLATLCVACGSDEKVEYRGSSRPLDQVTVALTSDEGATPRKAVLDCGDEAGCAELRELDADVLEPVDGTQACTELYGGPEVVTITGTLDDTDLDATFNRTNGCEIKRYDALEPLLQAIGLG